MSTEQFFELVNNGSCTNVSFNAAVGKVAEIDLIIDGQDLHHKMDDCGPVLEIKSPESGVLELSCSYHKVQIIV